MFVEELNDGYVGKQKMWCVHHDAGSLISFVEWVFPTKKLVGKADFSFCEKFS